MWRSLTCANTVTVCKCRPDHAQSAQRHDGWLRRKPPGSSVDKSLTSNSWRCFRRFLVTLHSATRKNKKSRTYLSTAAKRKRASQQIPEIRHLLPADAGHKEQWLDFLSRRKSKGLVVTLGSQKHNVWNQKSCGWYWRTKKTKKKNLANSFLSLSDYFHNVCRKLLQTFTGLAWEDKSNAAITAAQGDGIGRRLLRCSLSFSPRLAINSYEGLFSGQQGSFSLFSHDAGMLIPSRNVLDTHCNQMQLKRGLFQRWWIIICR